MFLSALQALTSQQPRPVVEPLLHQIAFVGKDGELGNEVLQSVILVTELEQVRVILVLDATFL